MTSYILNDDQRRLVEENMALARYILNKYFGSEISMDEDYVQEAYFGLCKAASTYNPDLQYRFSTYAAKCILDHIYRIFRAMNRKSRKSGLPVISLNEHIINGEGEEAAELIDMVPDGSENTEERVINKIICDSIRPLIPTYIRMQEEHLNVLDIARLEKTTKQCISNRKQRELDRARRVLEGSERPYKEPIYAHAK